MTRRGASLPAVASVLLAVATLLATPVAARGRVRVLALSDALDPAVLDEVGRAIDADVLVDGVATPADAAAALRASGAAYDLALLPAEVVGGAVKPDLLLPIGPEAIAGTAILPPLTAALGAEARVAVPFDWYPTGFAVNPAKLRDAELPADPAGGWDVLGRPDLLRRVLACGFGWPGEAASAYAVVATALGDAPPERRRALALLTELRGEARKGTAAERADAVASGDGCAAVLPAPDAFLAAARARAAGQPAPRFALPSGGAPLSVDVLVLPASGRDRAGGVALLRALTRAPTMIANAHATSVAPAVADAAADPVLDPVVLARLRPLPPLDPALLRAVTAAWNGAPAR